MISIWVYSAYSLALLLSLPEAYLNEPAAHTFELAQWARQIDAGGTIGLVVWIVASAAIGWRSRRLADVPPSPSLGHQPS
jgi:hypothetical protein